AGKTTFMKSLAGIIKPKQGTIHVDGMDVLKTSVEKLSSHISYIYQNPEEMFIQDTIKNDITYFGDVRNIQQNDLYEHITNSLNIRHINSLVSILLSRGQQTYS